MSRGSVIRASAALIVCGAVALSGLGPVDATPPQPAPRTAAPAPSTASCEGAGGTPLAARLATARTGSGADRTSIVELVSRTNELSNAEVETLAQDSSVRIDPDCNVFYAETFSPPPPGSDIPGRDVPLGRVPSGRKIFKLETRPKAKRTIYLNFKGGSLKDTLWPRVFPGVRKRLQPFSLDSRTGNVSTKERRVIYETWLGVASMYGSHKVNVTTKRPKSSALQRTRKRDKKFGVQVSLTSAPKFERRCSCSGIAFLNSFARKGKRVNRLREELAFTTRPIKFSQGNLRYIAYALTSIATHEVGHTLRLKHDGERGGAEYHRGNGVWQPVMGAGGSPVVQFDKGAYRGADNKENDLRIINSQLPRIGDKVKTGFRKARPIASGVTRSESLRAGDRDSYRFVVEGGVREVQLVATPIGLFSPLDMRMVVRNTSKVLINKTNPTRRVNSYVASGLGVGVTFQAGPGTYLVTLEPGEVTSTTGKVYSTSYGSYGRYRLGLSIR